LCLIEKESLDQSLKLMLFGPPFQKNSLMTV
jgi:hypothetical protein